MYLYIIATPIGNLQDITLRALEVLKSVDLLIAEDTRRLRQLLNHFGISKPVLSYHAHSHAGREAEIIERLRRDQNIGLVTDAGTPIIADPGSNLINTVSRELPEVKIIPIPGASSVTAALSVAGFGADKFSFWGYPPKKGQKRIAFFENLSANHETQVFFSTPHAIIKDLTAVRDVFSKAEQLDRPLIVAREMTKLFESFYRGAIDEVIQKIQNSPQKGEFAIVISKLLSCHSRPDRESMA
ncbi:MAG: 16S rRNA (cytidine(1402)-2'-O)-methyltransferase [Candidatus Jacksonbacteria bacterium RIFOXYC2_FULL_44_29]|nr:MAG: Ribosomal RNA small subunit methyltransferase I [Parcubacteria group bacterium GW2011_GWA2_42_28]KKT55459.1 MAG: Ribosomal RNA small subunit methyltransferase I [Parcubacteria group bacterium GW2011_GWC2_44_22]OGY75232.1 MAG: 16S rRNA (cytidine(1402)-2'-O)-methyltransferase [Candidatus Jacksonbacteria bacterium RIFOXYA2_FULL_43_12]OGY75935.1 MAG: 16S rRNA (cytidine(1402)-2'-O)-methyltransferase [Candidatus Jacksonbacteria bacterium RIFOXYB2_FULL_44_15]OGY77950.1 MAG: 16S rRNA (cytidine(